MNYLAMTLPNGQTITAPSSVPQGGLSKVSQIVGVGVTIMIIIAAVLSLFYLVLGGIQWTTSGGDKQKVAQARSRITFAIVGLIVAMASFAIVTIIGGFFNIPLLGSQ
jgi:hypothetical protein